MGVPLVGDVVVGDVAGVLPRLDPPGQGPALGDAEAAEDPVGDLVPDGVGEALLADLAHPARPLGLVAGLSLAQEEQVGAELGAQGVAPPRVEVVVSHGGRRRRRRWG
jgi:hypothetical protein